MFSCVVSLSKLLNKQFSWQRFEIPQFLWAITLMRFHNDSFWYHHIKPVHEPSTPAFSVNELIICYHVLSDPFSTHSPHPWRPFQAKHTIHLWNEHWQHLWEWISLHCYFTLHISCHLCHIGIMVSQISGKLQGKCQSSISLVLCGENPPVTGWFPTLRANNAESISMFDITMELKPLMFAHRVYYLCCCMLFSPGCTVATSVCWCRKVLKMIRKTNLPLLIYNKMPDSILNSVGGYWRVF